MVAGGPTWLTDRKVVDSNEMGGFPTLKNTEENWEDSTNTDHTCVEDTYQK